jgi:arabinogalactan oligomer/maltooligosaccharide transport system permease protein
MSKVSEKPKTAKVAKAAKVKKLTAGLNDGGTPSLHGTIVKIVALGIVDAISLLACLTIMQQHNWLLFGIVIAVTLLLNWVFLRRGGLPAKYLAPGLVFMAIFQFYVIGFSGYIAFTNYGGGHMVSKDEAISSLVQQGDNPVENSPVWPLSVVENSNHELGFLLTEADPTTGVTKYEFGSATETVHEVTNPTMGLDGVTAAAIDGWNVLTLPDLQARFTEVQNLRVFLPGNTGVFYKAANAASNANQHIALTKYDSKTDTLIRFSDNTKFTDRGHGAFESAKGEQLLPGWRSEVGFGNFIKAVTNTRIRGPLLAVTAWTFAFAAITVFGAFAIGLALALLFNDERLRGRKIYRVLVILPYAFPAFLSALVWQSMLNTRDGFINMVILGGQQVPWLQDALLAKVAVLMVNFWLGFPYMFLISTGALQSIPAELTESAKIDGATPWQQFRYVKLPLLLVSVSPLLITSFAFNFNNFTLIYLVTGGGPKMVEADMDVGHTDILITLVYKIAFNTGNGADYGLASAFSILIFLVVGFISYLGFRRTRTLEDVD